MARFDEVSAVSFDGFLFLEQSMLSITVGWLNYYAHHGLMCVFLFGIK